MAEPQFPDSNGWGLWAYGFLLLVGAAGAALQYPVMWLSGVLGLRRRAAARAEAKLAAAAEAAERKIVAVQQEAEARLKEHIEHTVREQVLQEMSPVRQFLTNLQKGQEGKQASLEQQITTLQSDMRDRDERLGEKLHQRITDELGELSGHLDTRFDDLRKHFSDVVHIALNGRRRT